MLANKIGRLAQGIRNIKGIKTIFFIPKSDIPRERLQEVTYRRIVVVYKPNKLEKNRSQLTVGGDRIKCEYDISTPLCNLTTIKIYWNSVLSTPSAKYATFDISNFYPDTHMGCPEYMRLPLKIIPPEIID